ncbi:phage integrase SAM-like domain-containing protein [Reichenbachiella sp.]|uniref:site-specific integrase n=1 Tax=Reichenbachiella sp. TaxID=2184521 RepID=UPI00329A2A0A
MSTVKAIVRKSKVNSKGMCTVYIRYGHKQKSVDFTTGIKVSLKGWNAKKEIENSLIGVKRNKTTEEFRKRAEEKDSATNSTIAAKKAQVQKLARDLQYNGMEPTIDNVKAEFQKEDGSKKKSNNKQDELLIDLMELFIKNSDKSDGTKANYGTVKYHLGLFEKHTGENYKVANVSLEFYDEFKSFLYHDIKKPDGETGLSDNTVGSTIKNLKVFLTYLQKRDYPIPNIIDEMKAIRVDTPIIFLNEKELLTLENYDFSSDRRLERVRDLFVFNCYTGLRVSDLFRLRKHHIVNGFIMMNSHKTSKDINVAVLPKPLKILEKYNYILPEISEQKYNEYIKEACEDAGIDQQIEIYKTASGNKQYSTVEKHTLITSHIAIKTFISICVERGMSPKTIASITGKTVNVIMKYYYGLEKKSIRDQMVKAFADQFNDSDDNKEDKAA